MTLSPRMYRQEVPRITVVSPPATPAATLDEVKAYARIEHTADDAVLLPMLMGAATRACEQHTRDKVFVTRTVELAYAYNPTDAWSDVLARERSRTQGLVLPVRPVQSIEAVTTFGDGDTEGTPWAADQYALDVDTVRLARIGASWPIGYRAYAPFVIRAVVGFGAVADVPDEARTAVAMCVADWYDNRVPGELPESAESVLQPLVGYRMRG